MGYLTLIFTSVSIQLGLPQGLLQSVCYVESQHKVSAIHYGDGKGNSIGICQIKLKAARQVGFKGGEKALLRPEINILYAGKYLKHQIARYKSTNKGVIAYNFGHAGSFTSSNYQRTVFKVWENQ